MIDWIEVEKIIRKYMIYPNNPLTKCEGEKTYQAFMLDWNRYSELYDKVRLQEKGMTNKETAEHIRNYIAGPTAFSWCTDGCGYDQHIRFVCFRNANWLGGTEKEFREFELRYADMIENLEDK